MFAVVRTGGKQYKVREGDTLTVERLPGQPGDTVELSEVLLVHGRSHKVGTPLVEGAKVVCELLEHLRGPKIVVYKFKRRKSYERKLGHRQELSRLRVVRIEG